MSAQDDLMTPAEVAQAFRVDVKTVSRWAQEGRLPCIRTLGGHRRYPREEVVRLMGLSTQGTAVSGMTTREQQLR